MATRHPSGVLFLVLSAIVVGTALTILARFVLVPLTGE